MAGLRSREPRRMRTKLKSASCSSLPCSQPHSFPAVTSCAGAAALVQDSAAVSSLCVRYQQLEEASASLRERIRHLDDMVHCQQKKVKQMVEEVSPCQRSCLWDCSLWRGRFGPRARPESQLSFLWLTVSLLRLLPSGSRGEFSRMSPW